MFDKRFLAPALVATAFFVACAAPAFAGGDDAAGDASQAAAATSASAAPSGLTAATMVSPDALADSRPAGVGVDYRIGPSDQLDVNVYGVGDLSRSVQVDAGGKIALPLVGEVNAQGETAQQLSDAIGSDLRRYVKNPLVTVIVKDAASQRVTVDGSVLAPGTYPLTGPTTLLQAVALAKGPDPKAADERRVTLFRLVNGQRQGAVYDLAAIRKGKAPDPEVYGRDIVVVPDSSGKAFWRHIVEIAPSLALLGAAF